MKQISVIVSEIIHVSTQGTNLTAASELAKQARRNKSKVIEGAATVEKQIISMISFYFFGRAHERKITFDSLVLNSDFCSFAAKRKLMTHIINEQHLLDGPAKNEFDKLLQKTMSYRNAFAHGTLSSSDTTVWLSYFEGGPRKTELTDDYLTTVEKTLLTAYEQCMDLEVKMGVIELHAGSETPPKESQSPERL